MSNIQLSFLGLVIGILGMWLWVLPFVPITMAIPVAGFLGFSGGTMTAYFAQKP